MNPTKKAILITIIALLVALETYSLISSAKDSYNEEKTKVNTSPYAQSTPQVVVIEPIESTSPDLYEEIHAELLFEDELIPSKLETQAFNFSDFYAFNQDTVGVLAIPGTNIYFPVCGSDNDEEWLETLFNGRGSAYGTIFLDYVANKNIDEKVSTLFGHNMKDGRMFAPLNKYLAYSDYFGKHQYASISTKDYIYIYKFACVARVTSDEAVALRQNNFKDEEEYKKYLEILKSRTKYKDDSVSLEDSDKLLQLMTCVGNHNYRTTVVFSYQEKIPNVLNNSTTTEEIQKSINDITNRKSSYFYMSKEIFSYNLPLSSNYAILEGNNGGIYIWTKDALTEEERTAFVEMYNLQNNYIFINGHNSFDIDGAKIAFESVDGDTKVFSEIISEKVGEKTIERSSIKSIRSGKFLIELGKEMGQERVRKID